MKLHEATAYFQTTLLPGKKKKEKKSLLLVYGILVPVRSFQLCILEEKDAVDETQ